MALSSFEESRDQLRKAWKKARHNLSEDNIHDLRVASRRMGASLLLLESVIGEDKSSKARRRVKRLMKTLGALRDVQVQIFIVKKWKKTESVKKFEELLESTERKEKNRVHGYLSRRRKELVLQELKDFEKDAAKRLKKIPQATIRTAVQRALAVQRLDLQAARKAMAANDPRTLHTVRRTARRLRYCLEAGAEIVGAAPRSEVQRLRRDQTRLGNKRDLQLLQAKFEGWQRRKEGE